MVVRAKFKLTGVKRYVADQWDDFEKQSHEMAVADLEFDAVKKDGEETENTSFWRSTPGGKIDVRVVNQLAIQELLEHLGGEFYVDFTWVPGTKPSSVTKIDTTTHSVTRYEGSEAKPNEYTRKDQEERAY